MANPLLRKASILAGALTGKVSFTGPDCVLISITDNCNFSCLNCRYHSSHTHSDTPYRPGVKRMPLELVRKIAAELKVIKPSVIIISGSGEPLLHPNLFEIIKLIKSTGSRIKLLTNGSLLNKATSTYLIDQGLDELRISLWAKNEKEFVANYPQTDPKYFQIIRENIQQISQLKQLKGRKNPTLCLHHPINRNNVESLGLLATLAQQWNLNEVSFSAVIPYPEVDQQSLLTEADIPQFRSSMRSLKGPFKELGIRHNIEQTVFHQEGGPTMTKLICCYNGWFQLRIQEDGLASPCNTCNIFVGNAHESSIEELWQGEKMQQFREKACTFRGLKEIARGGFCQYCCSYHVNRRIHRIVSRIPFIRAGR